MKFLLVTSLAFIDWEHNLNLMRCQCLLVFKDAKQCCYVVKFDFCHDYNCDMKASFGLLETNIHIQHSLGLSPTTKLEVALYSVFYAEVFKRPWTSLNR